MNFTAILIFWTLTGVVDKPRGIELQYDWRPIGEFANSSACKKAAEQLKLKPEYYRCLDTQMRQERR